MLYALLITNYAFRITDSVSTVGLFGALELTSFCQRSHQTPVAIAYAVGARAVVDVDARDVFLDVEVCCTIYAFALHTEREASQLVEVDSVAFLQFVLDGVNQLGQYGADIAAFHRTVLLNDTLNLLYAYLAALDGAGIVLSEAFVTVDLVLYEFVSNCHIWGSLFC